MTMDASAGKEECVLVKLERENPENAACGKAKEDVEGSYVFVNNDSDDSNAVDLEIDVKSESSADHKPEESSETDQKERDPASSEVREETASKVEEIVEIQFSGDSSGETSSSASNEHNMEDENPASKTEESGNSFQESEKEVAESSSENDSPELNAAADNSISPEDGKVTLSCKNVDYQDAERGNAAELDAEEKIISESEIEATDINISSTESSGTRENLSEQRERKIYLIRVPRFSDNNLRAQIEKAQRELEEKTKNRDAIRGRMQNQKVACTEHRKKVEEARREERECRDAVAGKRQEIDSVQSMLEKLKNFRLVNDLSHKIEELQHRISHETNTLKEEKSLMKEIKLLKQNRDHLSSSLSSEELQEAFENREQMQTHVQTLKEELDSLRKKAQLVEGELKSAKNGSDREHSLLRELQAEYKKADELQQEAYLFVRDLRRDSYSKNRHFYSYKDDLKAVANFNAAGDRESLRVYCTRQVSHIMDMWNNDDEFRKRYVEVNASSVVRRFKTLDGRSLGLDEEPIVIPAPVDPRETVVLIASDPLTKSAAQPLTKTEEETTELTAKPVLIQEEVKPSRDEAKEKKRAEDEERERKDGELARRDAEAKREKEMVEERERLRLQQIEKAKEAEDRKRKKAEKAQARAEARAQREAEMREKKKKARQEKKRKDSSAAQTVDEDKEENGTEEEKQEKSTQEVKKKRPIKPTRPVKEPKSVPLPIRNKGKRKLQAWFWPILAAILIVSILFIATIQRW